MLKGSSLYIRNLFDLNPVRTLLDLSTGRIILFRHFIKDRLWDDDSTVYLLEQIQSAYIAQGDQRR